MKIRDCFVRNIVLGVVVLSLVGCGSKDAAVTAPEEAATQEVQETEPEAESLAEESEEPVAMGNPMVEVTDKATIEELSYGLESYGGADVKSFIISDTLFERQYTVDDIDYTLRTQKGDEYEDISGMYYEWTVVNEEMINDRCPGYIMRYIGDEGYVDLVTWYDADRGVNYSISAVSADLDGYDIMAVVEAQFDHKDLLEKVSIPGLPSDENITDMLNSFSTWAGLQSFYDGLSFDELNADVVAGMAAFTAQTQAADAVYDEQGSHQIITEEMMNDAMMDLFGEIYDISNISDEAKEKGHLELAEDNSVLLQLGDWGLVIPKLEITAINKRDDSDEFTMGAMYYAYDLEEDERMPSIPTYVCTMRCCVDENSEYGFIIKEMSGWITGEE